LPPQCQPTIQVSWTEIILFHPALQ
jgi:hypothetical protein